MADETEETGESSGARVAGASAVPREKPLIEGRAEKTDEEGQGESGVEVPPENPWDALPTPATAEVTPLAPEESVAQEAPAAPSFQRNFSPVWPIAAAIVIAALLAVGGAFGLHALDQRMLDKTPANLAALESLVATLQHRSASSETSHALDQRVTALEAARRDLETSIAGLRAELDKLAAQKPAAMPDLKPLEARVGALEERLSALDAKVGALVQKLGAGDRQVSAAAVAGADSEAIAILAANLLHEVESGAPYAADLAALANRGFEKNKLAPLEASADSGVATPAALAGQFARLVPAIRAAAPPPKESGFLDHLVKGAERLVRVEKIGDTSGNDLAGHIARIRAALDSGAVETAYQEWSELPAAAKAKSQAFGASAKTRIDAIAAARGIEAEAMAALGKARS